jgi:hypothetical protein
MKQASSVRLFLIPLIDSRAKRLHHRTARFAKTPLIGEKPAKSLSKYTVGRPHGRKPHIVIG